ncbi:MAG: DUF177 domain-containing protein [Oscillospiraceae bacterium]|nr:DUF177 domain-containing protein [Oscillospiraceae bacterium]
MRLHVGNLMKVKDGEERLSLGGGEFLAGMAELAGGHGLTVAEAEFVGTLHNGEGMVSMRGRARLTLGGDCYRCGKAFGGMKVACAVKETFALTDGADGKAMVASGTAYPIEERRIDICRAIWENAMVETPAKLLCRVDCMGLCPKCGADLNEGPCGCGGPVVEA